MNYLQFNFKIDNKAASDSLLAILSVYDFDNFEETDNLLKAFIPQHQFDEIAFKEVIETFPGLKFTTFVVENINWNAEWEANFQPVIIDDFAGIRAHFHQPLQQVKHEIIITPKMSFGTGHHATTFMMVELMRMIEFTDRSVIDFGTGTGVLAILAKQLNAAAVVAIDNDEWSIENAKENFAYNAVSGIDLVLSDTLPENKAFDIVLANINLNFILANMQTMSKSVSSSGFILLSGFLVNDMPAVNEALVISGLTLKSYKEQNNWAALTALKAP